jgi:hypothetical protein
VRLKMFGLLFIVEFAQFKNWHSLARKKVAHSEIQISLCADKLWQTKAIFSNNLA